MAHKKILIIEDKINAARQIKAILENMGYVTTRTSVFSEKTIKMIEMEKPDLVIINMLFNCDRNKLNLAVTIQNAFKIPIVYIVSERGVKKIMKNKMNASYGCLVPPFRYIDLRTTIEMAFHKHNMEQMNKTELQNNIKNTNGEFKVISKLFNSDLNVIFSALNNCNKRMIISYIGDVGGSTRGGGESLIEPIYSKYCHLGINRYNIAPGLTILKKEKLVTKTLDGKWTFTETGWKAYKILKGLKEYES